ncbi:MAG: RNA polymerase sigma factor [Terracidiphilus sp.]|jgi:RNA polymerase sigma-70 factor (ECF subfamily)
MARDAQPGADERESRKHLLAFRQGDVDAFETLFRRHQGAVYGWVLRIVRNPATADELTVETFWRVYRAHARFEPAHGFEGWARRIATRAALDWMRGRRAEVELTGELLTDPAAPAVADPAVSAEIRLKTALAFARLPPKLRIAATLAVVEEQSQREVAEALGISLAAVKLRVFRALRLLRKDLERQGIRP